MSQQEMKTSSSSLEVEQKFLLTKASDLEPTLQTLGFESQGTKKFVDWYFDVPSYELTTKDCWLRFRYLEIPNKGGAWELKRGRGQNSSSTVYEEIEGVEAIEIVKSMLLLDGVDDNSTQQQDVLEFFDRHKIPVIPNFPTTIVPLAPFCRLETTRSSWKLPDQAKDNEFEGLSIDLDSTDTGYTVGEVETLVANENEIDSAKRRIQVLIERIVEKDALHAGPPVGKLEHYLMNRRKDHYEACIASGVIQRK